MSKTINVDEFDDYKLEDVLIRYRSHFSVVYLYVIDQLENDSSNKSWADAFFLWQYLEHLNQSERNNLYPNKSFTECAISKWPFASHYGDYSKIKDNKSIYSITEIDDTNPEDMSYQNLYSRIQALKLVNGLETEGVTIKANNPTDILRFLGTNGIEVSIDPLTNKVIISGTGSGGGDPIFDTLLADEIAMPESHGGYPAGTTVAQIKGQFLKKILEVILFPTVPPVYLSPLATLVGTDPGPSTSPPRVFEVGEAYDLKLTATFQQRDGGPVLSYQLKKDGVVIANSVVYTDLSVVYYSPKELDYSGVFNYDIGPIKQDSNGNDYLPGRIQAGSISTLLVMYNWIYPYFWGITTTPEIFEVETGLPANAVKVIKHSNNSIAINFNSPDESHYLWFAVPAGSTPFTGYYVAADNLGSIGSPSDLFDAPTLIQVTTPNYSNVDYDFYVSNFGTEINQLMTLNK